MSAAIETRTLSKDYSGGVEPDRVAALAGRLELGLGRRFREYSRGNKQKLGLLLAFMHRPELLILDSAGCAESLSSPRGPSGAGRWPR